MCLSLLGQALNLDEPLVYLLTVQFFHPLSYKFIVLDLVGLYPNSFGFRLQFVTLQYIYIYIYFFFLVFIVQVNLINTKICIFYTLRKSNKKVDAIDLFNKQIVLGLKNFDLFNKCVKLVSYIIKYS